MFYLIMLNISYNIARDLIYITLAFTILIILNPINQLTHLEKSCFENFALLFCFLKITSV